MNVRELIIRSQQGDKESMSRLIETFIPLMNRYSYLFGRKDEDLYSEMLLAFFKCVKNFKINEHTYIQRFNIDKSESDCS